MHDREPKVAALVAEGEAFVVKAEEVQCGGVETAVIPFKLSKLTFFIVAMNSRM